MATAEEIAQVRASISEPDDIAPYTDAYLSALIDESGTNGATLLVWRQKAANYSTKVDVTEAGATHKFGDLFKNAQSMVKYWGDIVTSEAIPSTPSVGPRVKRIVRL